MYKIDEWKNYRNQIGLTRIRHENQKKHARNQSMGVATDRSQFVRAGLQQVGGDLTEESSLQRLSTSHREQITQAIHSLIAESLTKETNNTNRNKKLGEQSGTIRQHYNQTSVQQENRTSHLSQKRKVLDKFIELSTITEPKSQYPFSPANHVNSAVITNRVAQEAMAQIGLEPGNKIASHLSFHLSVNHSPKHPSESKLITVQVPPRTCGPTKNLY